MVLPNCVWYYSEVASTNNINVFCLFFLRNVYLGLIAGLRAGCSLLYIVLFVLIMRRFKPDDKEMTDIKNAEGPTSKEPATVNKKEILPGAQTSEESEETYM